MGRYDSLPYKDLLPYKEEKNYRTAVASILEYNTRTNPVVVYASILYVEGLGFKIETREGQIRVQEEIWARNRAADGIS
ncbi:MAG: hypothetical protein LBM93_13950 [Oscillospiraceae bacterium]|jgi:hypothetical protein|nr:hypothetical protein [Oscillospiraceae bacterium]